MANTKIQSEQIQDGAITAAKIADGAIVAAELADNSVTTAKINADAVTGAKIADDAINSEHYTDGSIDTAHIADAQITVAKMAANSVDSDQYVDGSIDTAHIADANITTAKIADDAVTSAKIDTNIDIAGTFDVTGATTLDAGATIVGSGTGAGLYLNGTNSDSVAQGNFVRYGTNFLTQSNAANSDLITYAFNGSTFVNALNIKSNGNVGIGTASPSKQLEIRNDTATSGQGGAELRLTRGDSSGAANDPIGTIEFYNTDADGAHVSSFIKGISQETYARQGALTFGVSQSNSTDATEAMRIDSSGNVGIGTTSPNAVLTTDPESGNFSSTYNNYDGVGLFIRGNGTSGNGNYGPALVFGSCDSDAANQDHKHSAISVVQTGTDPNETGLAFWTHPSVTSTDALSEAMRIDSSGNVGIGTPSPATELEVKAASGYAELRLQGASGSSGAVEFYNAASKTGDLYFDASNNFLVRPAGTEKMRIESGGDVGIGVSNPSARLHIYDGANATEATAQLKIEGSGYVGHHWLDGTAYYIGQNSSGRALRLYSNAETAGVQLSAGGTSFGTFSDERLKENIQDIGSVTDKIKDIRCVSFNRTDIEDSKETIGFIAQDFVGKFDQVLDKTKLRDGDEEEYYSIKYTETIPVLLKAIQEQQTIIEDLKTRIETLEG